MRLGVIFHGCGNRFVQQGQIEVFDVHEIKLGVAALLCDLVNPFSYRLTVTTGPRAMMMAILSIRFSIVLFIAGPQMELVPARAQ